MASDLDGRHVAVTGGTGALGRAVVDTFLTAGAICHVPHRGAAPPADMPRSDRLRLVGGVDVSDESQVARFYRGVPALWASVQAAGGFAARPFLDTARADLQAQLDLNLVTCFLCCREAVRAMGGRAGRVVNVASRSGVRPETAASSIAYAISKAGVIALTQALAAAVGPSGILVNAVLPSTIDTPANRSATPGAPEVYARWPKPAQIAGTILWLASPENHLTSGAAIPAYGDA